MGRLVAAVFAVSVFATVLVGAVVLSWIEADQSEAIAPILQVVATRPIAKGATIQRADLDIVLNWRGNSTLERIGRAPTVVGFVTKQDIQAGTALQWSNLEPPPRTPPTTEKPVDNPKDTK